MNKAANAIMDFAHAFGLTPYAEGFCFEARLLFYTRALIAQLESEVHIINLQATRYQMIHILSPVLAIEDFPYQLDVGEAHIRFEQGKGLIIKGHTALYKSFKLSIIPLGDNCRELTLAEIKSRNYN